MTDFTGLSSLQGGLIRCPVCLDSNIGPTSSDRCEFCHRTGAYVPLPNGTGLVALTVAIYEGEEKDGKRTIGKKPEEFVTDLWLPCCEYMRSLALQTAASRFSAREHGPILHVRDYYIDISKSDEMEVCISMSPGPALRFCPNCGAKTEVRIIGKKVRLTKMRKTTQYVETETVEERL